MLQLEDLVANYPSFEEPGIQTLLSAKRELIEVRALPSEPRPIPGITYYNNQRLLLRLMRFTDRMLINWQTGTGKTCGLGILAEYYHDLYLRDPENAPIKRTIVLVPGPGLKDSFKLQIACDCTSGQYITPMVENATRERNRKGNLTRELNQWYTIKTYQKFLLQLADLSDEEIRRIYSRTIIFVDEAHNLNVSEKGNKNTRKNIFYTQLWRLFHLVEGCKIILSTATTMINETIEIATLMNLLLDADKQLPVGADQEVTDWNYDTVTLEQMEPYLRGKVSYVRSLNTGINLELVGDPIEVVIPIPEEEGREIITTNTITISIMESDQEEAYFRAMEIGSGVYDNERQVSNFVFPDGSWGGKFPRKAKNPEEAEVVQEVGLGRYVISPSNDTYRATQEFQPWLRIVDNPIGDEPHLGRLSRKYERIIREVLAGTTGTVYNYNEYVFGSGAIVQALAFEANGFERFRGDTPAFQSIKGATLPHPCVGQNRARRIVLDKRPRVALITSETSPVNVTRILELFSSPENVHGEYLKVLIGSEVTREGLNLAHVTQIHLVTTWWNRAANYQAISRAIRATSHVLLLEEERQRLQREGLDPDTAVVSVLLFQHASVPIGPDGQPDLAGSVDVYMYQVTDAKDYSIRRMERILKRCAVDCQLNYERNVREGDVKNSPVCDYTDCDYACVNPYPTQLDETTYDVYYIDEVLRLVSDRIVEVFAENFSLRRVEIYALLEEFREVEVDRALTQIMATKRVIYDRYGFISYLREDRDRFFLQRDFPLNASGEASQILEIYASNLISSREVPLNTYLSRFTAIEQEVIIAKILALPLDSPNLPSLVKSLSNEGRINLLEKAVYTYVIENATPLLQQIIELFSLSLFIIYEPIEDIQSVGQSLIRTGKVGRPPKNTGQPRVIKFNREDLKEEVEEIPLIDTPILVVEGTDKDIVFLHNLFNQKAGRAAYDVTTAFKKGNGHLRIFKPNERVGWRDVKANEIPVYGAVVEEIIDRIVAPFEQFQIYGTILADGEFRFHDRTTQKSRKQNNTQRDDARFGKRGKKCATADLSEIITILYKLGIEAPPSQPEIPEDPNELFDYLIRKKIINVNEDPANWDEERLDYYARWEAYGYKADLCEAMRKHFEQEGSLLVLDTLSPV